MNTEKQTCILLLVFLIILSSASGLNAEEVRQTANPQQSAAQVSNLDVPANKDLTVQSELERGSSAFFLCDMQMMEISNPTWCVMDILREEQLKKTDTSAFKLGVYFRGWFDMDNYKQLLTKNGNYLVNDEVSEYILLLTSYRSLQSQLNFSDKELCDAVGLEYEVVKLKIDNAVREFQQ